MSASNINGLSIRRTLMLITHTSWSEKSHKAIRLSFGISLIQYWLE